MNGEENMERADETPFLSNNKDKNTFGVPDGYFENLLHQTISQTKIEESLSKKLFTPPSLYFEELEINIKTVINIDDWNSSKSTSAFKVPELYFESSAQSIISKSSKTGETRIFNINFIKYAAAACVLIASSVGIYLNVSKEQTLSYKISNLPKEEIVNYLQLHSESNDVNLIIENLEDVSLLEEQVNGELEN